MDLIENLSTTTLSGAVQENEHGFFFEHVLSPSFLSVKQREVEFLNVEKILQKFQWGFRNHHFIADARGLVLKGRISRLV